MRLENFCIMSKPKQAGNAVRSLVLAIALAMVVGLVVVPRAGAVPTLLTNTNVDTFVLGDPVVSYTDVTSDFISTDNTVIGTLELDVSFDSVSGIYSYLYTVAPDPDVLHLISEFTANFNVLGFDPINNPDIHVGSRFSDNILAGAPEDGSTAFNIVWDPDDGKIHWLVNEVFADNNIDFWDAVPRIVPITFGLQSTYAPGGGR